MVTGAGRGLGRSHALELARHGAIVVVNDLDPGSAEDPGRAPAADVVAEIEAQGGTVVADGDDAADWDGARPLVEDTVSRFGQLDPVVNNAGILRDRTLDNMNVDEWDAVIRVHLRSTFCMSHGALVSKPEIVTVRQVVRW